jgi:hypothetical protein
MSSAKRSKSYTAAEVVLANGVKTSFATVAAPVALTTADWNGAGIGAAGLLDLPRTITITRSNNASQFSVSPIVLTGVRGGTVVTESITPGSANGNDTLRGTQAFDFLTNIDLPTQGGTGGTFTIGLGDICAPQNGMFCGFEAPVAAGNVGIAYSGNDSAVVLTDVIPIPAVAIGFMKELTFRRIVSATTTAAVTVYLP